VANSKYVQTEFGTKRLKEFFSESMQMSDGEEVSTIEVKKILAELIVVFLVAGLAVGIAPIFQYTLQLQPSLNRM
jgi:hypothetical protein